MIDTAKAAAFPIGEFSIPRRVAIIMAYRARLEQTVVEFRRRKRRFGGPPAQTGSSGGG
jgi:hypothetical protein